MKLSANFLEFANDEDNDDDDDMHHLGTDHNFAYPF